MEEIKFSHNYPKLWDQETAYLILIRETDFRDISEKLLDYDTKNSKGGYYPLPKGKLLQLFFIGNEGIPFCTIRRYTPEKLLYYLSLIHTSFKILIEEKK